MQEFYDTLNQNRSVKIRVISYYFVKSLVLILVLVNCFQCRAFHSLFYKRNLKLHKMSELDLETIALNFCSDDIPDVQLDIAMRNRIAQLLGTWYKDNRRRMPWRGDDTSIERSAYGTWISEVMLQQTRVETVIEYWKRWMETFPDISTLAKATPDDVNRLWAGLGYYRRAQMLLQGAIKIQKDFNGIMPETITELLTIPGIGPYTAGAISSIAFNKSESLVDGNVIRVFSRLFALKLEVGGGKMEKLCWKIASQLVPKEPHSSLPSPGDFNQGLMELGAVICKPTSPNCDLCPLKDICYANILVKHTQLYDNNQKKEEEKLITNKKENQIKTSLDFFIKSNKNTTDNTNTKIIDIEDITKNDTKPSVFPYDISKLPREITEFPYKIMKKQPKELIFDICVLRTKLISSLYHTNNNTINSSSDSDITVWKYLFVRRPEKGLLANQWEFPSLLYKGNKVDHISSSSSSSSSSSTTGMLVEEEDNKEKIKERNGFTVDSWNAFLEYFNTQLGLQWDSNTTIPTTSSCSSINETDKNRYEETVIEIASMSDFEPIVHVFSHQRHTMRIVLKDVVVVKSQEGYCSSGSSGSGSNIDATDMSGNTTTPITTSTSNTTATTTTAATTTRAPVAVVSRWMTAEEIVAAGITTGCKKILHAVTKHNVAKDNKHTKSTTTTVTGKKSKELPSTATTISTKKSESDFELNDIKDEFNTTDNSINDSITSTSITTAVDTTPTKGTKNAFDILKRSATTTTTTSKPIRKKAKTEKKSS